MVTTTQRAVVVGVFQDRGRAEQAVADLRHAGFRDDQISYVTPHREETATTAKGTTEEDHAGTGAAVGAVSGGVLGGLAGAVAAGLIPGVGPFLAAGILGATVVGAGVGAAAGGLVGALIGMGVPEEEARYYESEAKAGRTIVTVRAETRYDEAWAILLRHGAYNQQSAGTTGAAATGATARTAEAGQTMQLHEEELHARKQQVEAGEVHVRKEVKTEHKTIDVPVKREEVVVERHPVAGGTASSADIRPGEEIRVPVMEEQVRVEKTPVVKEEVRVGKRQVQETEQVGGPVRKEEVRVERKGDVDVQGNVAGPADKTTKQGGKKS